MFRGAEDHFDAWVLTLALPDLPLSVRGYRSATSTHETTPNEIDLPLSLSGVNYWAPSFRLRQHSDASSHLSDSARNRRPHRTFFAFKKKKPPLKAK